MENFQSIANLVDLNSSVYHEGQVCNANANDLNGVLHAQRIPHDDQLVQESEDEEGEESGNRLFLGGYGTGVIAFPRLCLKLPKDIAKGFTLAIADNTRQVEDHLRFET